MKRTEICWKRPSNRPLKEDDRKVPLLSPSVTFILLLSCRCLTSLAFHGCHDGTLLKTGIIALLLPFTGLTAGYKYYNSPKSNVFYNQPMNKFEDDNDTPILSIFIDHKVLSRESSCV